MNHDEVCALLATAMAYDNRKPGDAAVHVWTEQAKLEGWTYHAAVRAIHEHYRRSTAFLMPGHITEILNEVRAQIRRQIAGDRFPPPRELADDPRAEIEWRRRRYAEFTERAMLAWAKGEQVPELPQYEALDGRERPALGPALQHLAKGAEVPPENRPARRPGHRAPAHDPARQARIRAARDELASIDQAEVRAKAEEYQRWMNREAS